MLPPNLRDFVLAPESKKVLMAILNEPVFIAACAYVAELSDPTHMYGTAVPDNILNRMCAVHHGQSHFYEELSKIVTTKKTDPVQNLNPHWGDAPLNPTA